MELWNYGKLKPAQKRPWVQSCIWEAEMYKTESTVEETHKNRMKNKKKEEKQESHN